MSDADENAEIEALELAIRDYWDPWGSQPTRLADALYTKGYRLVDAARDEEKFLEGAHWALRAEGVEDVDRAIQNIRDAQTIKAEREQR